MRYRSAVYRTTMACAFAAMLWLSGCAKAPPQNIAVPSVKPTPSALPTPRMALSNFDSAYIDHQGVPWAWGLNEDGMLGLGHTKKQIVPARVAENVRSVEMADMQFGEAASPPHGAMFFVKEDNTLWACGYNAHGVLGDGTAKSRTTPKQIMGDVREIAIGWGASAPVIFVTKLDGTLWYWGRNFQDGMVNPEIIMSGVNVRAVVPDVLLTFIITQDDELFAFTPNKDSEMNGEYYAKPQRKMGGVRYAGYSQDGRMLLHKADGTVWVQKDASAPDLEKVLDDIVFCRRHMNTATAIDQNGELYAWSFGAFGSGRPKAVFQDVQSVAMSSTGAPDFDPTFYVLDHRGRAYQNMKDAAPSLIALDNIRDICTENGRVYFLDANGAVFVQGDPTVIPVGTTDKSAIDKPVKLIFK